MNQQQYSRRPQQQQRQVQDVMVQCRKCGSAINERLQNQHERGCKPRIQPQQYQSRRPPQQQTNIRQQQSNPSNRMDQNRINNFQQNFEWVNNPFFQQNNQQTQSDQSDDSDEEEDQGNETQQPGFQYSCQVSGNQMPDNVKIEFSAIFGPNGVFTQSMNHMSSVMQSVNINFDGRGNQYGPNGYSNQQTYFCHPDQQQYEQDDEEDDQEEEEEEQEEEEEDEQGLDDEQISQMPTIQYRGGKGVEGSSKHCVVCMTDFKQGDRLRTLRCFHKFHANCVDNWLRMKKECPICRFDQTK